MTGGLLLGAALGFVFSHALSLTSDHLFEMGISTVLAYGAYVLGDRLHVSPVITVVTAGIVVGNYGRDVGLSERARTVVIDIWVYLAFVANSIIFVLIGKQLTQVHYDRYLGAAATAVYAAYVAAIDAPDRAPRREVAEISFLLIVLRAATFSNLAHLNYQITSRTHPGKWRWFNPDRFPSFLSE